MQILTKVVLSSDWMQMLWFSQQKYLQFSDSDIYHLLYSFVYNGFNKSQLASV